VIIEKLKRELIRLRIENVKEKPSIFAFDHGDFRN
jgi:hypothetical protein